MPPRGMRRRGGACAPTPSRSEASTRSASPARVGASNRVRSGTSAPNASRMRETTRVASSECPPTSKKLSCAPTRSSRSTSAQIPARISSAGVRGAVKPSSVAEPDAAGAGRARRSTLPLDVSGSDSSTTTTPGTMYSGSRSARCRRSSAAAGVAPASGTT